MGGIKTENHFEIFQNKIELQALLQEILQKSILSIGDDYDLTFIKESESAEPILKVAKKIKADLIYIISMGSQNRRVLKNRWVDSVTENVLFKTIVPVLVIPTKKIIRYSNENI
jgi:nucleotide-binding universal stress UspA family protein